MTVAELIELLKEMPQDALAVVRGYESGYDDIGSVKRITVKEKDEIWRDEREKWLKQREKGETDSSEDISFSSSPGWWDGWYDDTGSKSFAKIMDGIDTVYIAENTEKNCERDYR